MRLKTLTPWKKIYDKPRQHSEKAETLLCQQRPSSQSYGFSSSHVWMWELDHKAECALTNWCFWTIVLEKALESPLDSKEIKTVNPKGSQSWIFIRRTDAEAEAPVLWSPDAKKWFIRKDLDAGKVEGRRRKGWERIRWLDGITDHWTWVWSSSGRLWRTGKPGMLQFVQLQEIGHDWATEQ